MPNAHVPVMPRDVIDFAAAGTDAGEVWRRREMRFPQNPLDGVVSTFPNRAIGPVGHRHEAGIQDRQPFDGTP